MAGGNKFTHLQEDDDDDDDGGGGDSQEDIDMLAEQEAAKQKKRLEEEEEKARASLATIENSAASSRRNYQYEEIPEASHSKNYGERRNLSKKNRDQGREAGNYGKRPSVFDDGGSFHRRVEKTSKLVADSGGTAAEANKLIEFKIAGAFVNRPRKDSMEETKKNSNINVDSKESNKTNCLGSCDVEDATNDNNAGGAASRRNYQCREIPEGSHGKNYGARRNLYQEREERNYRNNYEKGGHMKEGYGDTEEQYEDDDLWGPVYYFQKNNNKRGKIHPRDAKRRYLDSFGDRRERHYHRRRRGNFRDKMKDDKQYGSGVEANDEETGDTEEEDQHELLEEGNYDEIGNVDSRDGGRDSRPRRRRGHGGRCNLGMSSGQSNPVEVSNEGEERVKLGTDKDQLEQPIGGDEGNLVEVEVKEIKENDYELCASRLEIDVKVLNVRSDIKNYESDNLSQELYEHKLSEERNNGRDNLDFRGGGRGGGRRRRHGPIGRGNLGMCSAQSNPVEERAELGTDEDQLQQPIGGDKGQVPKEEKTEK